ncbi:MAG TPA: hypothetical protein VIJ01_19145 [Candidatus Angelobacter sp.]
MTCPLKRPDLGGVTAYKSFPMPDNDSHSLDIMPQAGTYVQIVAYKGGPHGTRPKIVMRVTAFVATASAATS